MATNAPACPHCGNPRTSRGHTVERTGKTWKFLILVSVIGIVVGLVIWIGTPAPGTHGSPTPEEAEAMRRGPLVFGLSVVVFILAKIGAWWNHG